MKVVFGLYYLYRMPIVELKLIGNVSSKNSLNICLQEIGMKCIDVSTEKKRNAKKERIRPNPNHIVKLCNL